MKSRTLLAVVLLIFAFAVTVRLQEPPGPRVKRPRTPEDYQAGTLKDLVAKAASTDARGNKEETMLVDSDLSPTRVTAKYASLTARTSERKVELIRQWARLYAGSLDTYKPYEVDVAFTENGNQYWLTFTQKTLTEFWKSDSSKPVDLFLIKMGSVKQDDKWVPVLLVESFHQTK